MGRSCDRHTIRTHSGHAHANDTTHDGVSGGDGETDSSSHSEVEGGSSDSADHAKHEKTGIVLEEGSIDDLGSDGIGDTGTDTKGASEFHNRGEDHGLEICDGPGTDGSGP